MFNSVIIIIILGAWFDDLFLGRWWSIACDISSDAIGHITMAGNKFTSLQFWYYITKCSRKTYKATCSKGMWSTFLVLSVEDISFSVYYSSSIVDLQYKLFLKYWLIFFKELILGWVLPFTGYERPEISYSTNCEIVH